MDIIKEITIKNYKGLKDIQFPCKSINIVVGPNNTGKSSILESIWLAVSSLNKFEDTLENSLDEILERFGENYGRYLIHQGEQESNITLKISENKKITLDLSYLEKGYPDEFADSFLDFINKYSIDLPPYYHPKIQKPISEELYFLIRELRRLKRAERIEENEKVNQLIEKISKKFDFAVEESKMEMINSKKLFITSKLNNKLIGVYAIMNRYIGEIPIFKGKISDIPEIPLVASHYNIGEEYLTELHKKLVNTNRLQRVINALKERISYFEDIREVKGDLLVILSDNKKPLPFSLMGDGFKALLKLSFMVPLTLNGIVLFEEPECSMHPGYLDILAEEIISNSKNSQFFISTHSIELVERILEKAGERNKLNSIQIIRTRRLSGGHIDREVSPGSEAKEEIEEIKTDLRGP